MHKANVMMVKLNDETKKDIIMFRIKSVLVLKKLDGNLISHFQLENKIKSYSVEATDSKDTEMLAVGSNYIRVPGILIDFVL